MIPQNNDVRFEVTTKCNYNCSICPREKITRKMETMGYDLFGTLLDKILKETGQYTTLTFSGMGEALLDDTLEEKIKYAKSRKLKVLILTNGSLLSSEKFKKLEELGVESIRVSFYGNDPYSYARVHGVREYGMFEKLKKNLTDIAASKKSTKLLLTFNVVNGANEKCVKGWIDYWKDKVDLIEVWHPHNWVTGRSYRKVQEKKEKTCGRPFKGPLQIQADGTVNMCCFDFNGELTLGDLKKQKLKEIFSSPMFKKIVRFHQTDAFKRSGLICENCDQRNTDKSDVMLYSSKFDIPERVNKISTTYMDVT